MQTALIPYITAGDPDLETTAEALRLLDACGADVIELGVPFSDPYADGPIIRASAARALAGGTTVDAVLSMLKEVTPELSCPVVLFSYLGPIVRRGAANFTAAVKEAGAQGLVVPDLPYAEPCAFRHEARKNNLELVRAQLTSTITSETEHDLWLHPLTVLFLLQLMVAGSTYNADHTSREDGGDRRSFTRVHLPCKCQWSYRSKSNCEPSCQRSPQPD
jgi:tryptophan synthase alpha subunit